MRKKTSLFPLLCIALLAGFALASCTAGPLPDMGLKHAAAALDRALLGNAFVAEVGRADSCDPEFGLFKGDQLAFLHAYAANCTPGEALGFQLDEWPTSSVRTGSCNPPQGFTLDIFSDDNPDGGRIATVLITAETTPGGNRAVHTQSTLLELEDKDGGPLGVGSVYDLVTEIGPDDELVRRSIGDNTMLVFDMFLGDRFFIEYGEGSEVIFNAPECPIGAETGMLFAQARVSGGSSGLGSALVVASDAGMNCLSQDNWGGPVPGRYDVTMNGVTTTVEYEMNEILKTMSFSASNTINGADTEMYCVVGETDKDDDFDGGMGIIEADFFIGSTWIVAGGLGEMSLHMDMDFSGELEPRSLLRFQTFVNQAFPASFQEEPSLLGLMLMMSGDGDDWCDEDEDGDGILNCQDPCPNNSDPGCMDWCDMDEDGDGVLNCQDLCPNDSDPCDDPWCYDDDDGDGMTNCVDGCPQDPDPKCDWCDMDEDGDGILNCQDPCFDNPDPQCQI